MTGNLRLTFLAVFTLGIMCLAGLSSAQEAQPPTLSLAECIDIALQNQIDVQTGQNFVESARARATQARSGYLPQASIEYSNPLVESGASRGLRTEGTALSVTQNFYDGGIREARVRGAQAEASQSRYSLDRTRQTVVFAVTRDYFNLLRARRLLEVEDARLKFLAEQLELIRARVEVGDAAQVDALPVEAQSANARVDQLQAQNSVRTASIQLQNTIGLSPRSDFAVQEVNGIPTIQPQPVDEYVRMASATRPEVGETAAGVKASKSSVDAARISLYPRPVISGQYDRAITGGFSNATGNDSFSIIGGIVFDIFNGGSNRAAYREARAGLENAQLRSGQLQKDIEADVRNAYLNLQSSRERLQASDLSLQAAQRNLQAQEERYVQGLAIPLDLLNAQSEVVRAESNAVQSRYDYYISLAQLEYAVGKQGGLYAE